MVHFKKIPRQHYILKVIFSTTGILLNYSRSINSIHKTNNYSITTQYNDILYTLYMYTVLYTYCSLRLIQV